MRVAVSLFVAVVAAVTALACGSTASPEKTGTETFGCYVGSCVSPGTGDDATNDDARAPDASDASDAE